MRLDPSACRDAVPPLAHRNGDRLGPVRPLVQIGSFLPWAFGLLSIVCWYFSLVPLHYTDLWGHLAYGRMIATTGHLPVREPFMPLAHAVPLVDTAWLTQWIGYEIQRWLDNPGLQQTHALLVTLCCGLSATTTWKVTRNGFWTVVTGGVWLATTWFQSHVIRPQIVGMACFGVLVWYLAPGRRPLRHPGWLVPLFAAWANLHGSFPLGFMLIGCAIIGRLIDCWRRSRQPLAGLFDEESRRLLTGLGLALAAVLVNPYGYQIYPAVVGISGNPNLADLLEWQPIDLESKQGQMLIAGTLAVFVLSAFSRRSTRGERSGELLAFAVLTVGTLTAVRYIVWWAAVCAPLIGRLCDSHCAIMPPRLTGRLAAGSALWWRRAGILLGFLAGLACLSAGPAGSLWSKSARLRERDALSPLTPVAIAKSLTDDPPAGQLFNTYEWGDYLVWAGPPGLPVFTTSHAHLLPPDVWRDYMTVVRRDSHWRDVLERYRVTTIVIDRRYRSGLIAELESDHTWEVCFADDLGVIFQRRHSDLPIPGESAP